MSISEDVKKRVLADWLAGVPQNQLPKRHGISKGSVNSICRGVDQKNVDLVERIAETRIELSIRDEIEADAVLRMADRKTKDLEFFRRASLKVAEKALELVQQGRLGMFDLEKAQMLLNKGKETLFGKSPETAVQINNKGDDTTVITWEKEHD